MRVQGRCISGTVIQHLLRRCRLAIQQQAGGIKLTDAHAVAAAWLQQRQPLPPDLLQQDAALVVPPCQQDGRQAGREFYVGVSTDNIGMLHRRAGNARAALDAFAWSTPMFQRTLGENSYDYWASNTERAMAIGSNIWWNETRKCMAILISMVFR